MLVFLLWPWRAKKGALKWFLFAWPVLGWELGQLGSQRALAQLHAAVYVGTFVITLPAAMTYHNVGLSHVPIYITAALIHRNV